jgi:hypothetical protein
VIDERVGDELLCLWRRTMIMKPKSQYAHFAFMITIMITERFATAVGGRPLRRCS